MQAKMMHALIISLLNGSGSQLGVHMYGKYQHFKMSPRLTLHTSEIIRESSRGCLGN